MIPYDIRKIKYIFPRLFVLAVKNQMHLRAFTCALEKSEFIQKVEADEYDDYFNKSILEIFENITSNTLSEDDSYGIYNDAYWSAVSYFELHLRTGKSFSYIFLKFPLAKMMDAYPVYHEMDFSSLYEYFQDLEKERTILRALCQDYRSSLAKISKATGISTNTLMKYNASDSALYKASFQNIIKIAKYFDVPISLFIE